MAKSQNDEKLKLSDDSASDKWVALKKTVSNYHHPTVSKGAESSLRA
jgi:hypothetical protein